MIQSVFYKKAKFLALRGYNAYNSLLLKNNNLIAPPCRSSSIVTIGHGSRSGRVISRGRIPSIEKQQQTKSNNLNSVLLSRQYTYIVSINSIALFRTNNSMNLETIRKSQLKNCAAEPNFWNQTFDKGRLKNFVLWFLLKHGEYKTVKLVEELKTLGFQYATKAGISLGIEDLMIPKRKNSLIMEAEQLAINTIKEYKRNEITGVERFQRLIDTWHRTSERLKQEVIENFEATDILNPVYMMAFSGARGNISQVRQLVGMRGLMSNPQGQIIDFPIRSNFREGLTLTEYIISSYGARKGIVDTALRTANAGYLTRRLVDVAQHVIISSFDCGTKRGIFLTDMKEGNKIIYSLQNRLIGRVLARDIYNQNRIKIASRNIEISSDLSNTLASTCKKVFVRSSLTCQTKNLVCQLCYGWSLAQGNLVGIGEAVGVVAAQSIGEPGTQLTMRTFHTGGVFSGDVSDQIKAPYNGIVIYDNPIAGTLIRTPEGKIAFLTKNEGSFSIFSNLLSDTYSAISSGGIASSESNNISHKNTKKFKIPFYTLLFFKNGEKVLEKEVIAQISSINRQKNATDQAEFTINAELSGQFFSKFLNLKENKVGPKLKATQTPHRGNACEAAIVSKSMQGPGPEIVVEQFNEDVVDTVFEAWGWGYAWVLSGKIYQLPQTSTFFPIIGDFVNNKTYMNKNKLSFTSSFGNTFKLSIPLNKPFFNKKNIKKLRVSKHIRDMSQNNQNLLESLDNQSLKDISQAYKPVTKKDITFLKTELISFQLSKIIYKKFGYFIKLTKPNLGVFALDNYSQNISEAVQLMTPLCPPSEARLAGGASKALPNVLSGVASVQPCGGIATEHQSILSPYLNNKDLQFNTTKEFFNSSNKNVNCLNLSYKTSILSQDDTVFLLSSLDKNFFETNNSDDTDIQNQKGPYKDRNSFIYPSKWLSSFDVFLNWFPKRFCTKTGGLIFMEPIFFNNLFKPLKYNYKGNLFLKSFTSISQRSGSERLPRKSFAGIKDLRIRASAHKRLAGASTPMQNSEAYEIKKNLDLLKQVNKIFPTTGNIPSSSDYPNMEKFLQYSGVHGNTINIKKYFKNKKIKNLSSIYIDKVLDSSFEDNSSFLNGIQVHLAKDESRNRIIYKIGTKNIQFFPTFVKRNFLKNKIKHASNKNKEIVGDKQFLPKELVNYSLTKSLFKDNDISKSLIFEQYQSKEIGTITIGTKKQSPSLGKNKKPPILLSYGLNWKNSFKLNFNGFDPSSGKAFAAPPGATKFYQKLENRDLQRVFYVPQSFYNFSLKKLAIKQKISIKNRLKQMYNHANYIDYDYIIQTNRQGKFKKYYLEEGYLNTHISTFMPTGSSEKQNKITSASMVNQFYESAAPWAAPTTMQLLKHQNTCMSSQTFGQTFVNNVSFPKIVNLHAKKLYLHSKFAYNIVWKEDPIFIFYKSKDCKKKIIINTEQSFKDPASSLISPMQDHNFLGKSCCAQNLQKKQQFFSKLVKQLKKRKKVLSLNSLYNINEVLNVGSRWKTCAPPRPAAPEHTMQDQHNYETEILPKLTLKTFSKMISFPYFLNKKSSNLLNKKFSNLNQTFSLKKKLLVTSKSHSQLINKKNKKLSLFNFHFYSFFNKNFKKKILLNNKKINMASYINIELRNKKMSQICSPYLKNQLKYSFYLLPIITKEVFNELENSNTAFYRILNENNFLSNSSFIYSTLTFFYKKGFFYLGFSENPIKKRQRECSNKKTNLFEVNNINQNNKINCVTLSLLRTNFFTKLYRVEDSCHQHQDSKVTADMKDSPSVSDSVEPIIRVLTFQQNQELNSFNTFYMKQRIKGFQIWLKKSSYYKKMFIKNHKYLNTYLSYESFKKVNKYLISSSIKKQRPSLYLSKYLSTTYGSSELTIQKSKSLFNRIANKKKYKIYKQAKNFLDRKKLSSLLNISIKPGWFYFTKNLSKFFLYNKNFIHPGKIIAEDFIFDHEPIYIEIIPFGKELQNLKTQDYSTGIQNLNSIYYNSNSYVTSLTKTSYMGDNKDKHESNAPFSGTPARKTRLTLSNFSSNHNNKFLIGENNTGTFFKKHNANMNTFIKVIKNNKCRFEPENLKKQDNKISEIKIIKKLENKDYYNNKGFFVLIRKASEYKLHKHFEYKKEMHKLSNQNSLNKYSISMTRKTSFLFTKNYNDYKWTQISPLRRYNILKNIEKTNPENKAFFSAATSSSCIIRFDNTARRGFSKWLNGLPVRNSSYMSHTDNAAVGSFKCKKGPAWKTCAAAPLSAAGHTDQQQGQLQYCKEHTIDLYKQFKTPFMNKQKIASQIISKYPSSDLKIISKIPFYSSLIVFKTKLFNSFQSRLSNQPFKKESLNINKQNLWGLPLSMIVAKGSINLSPFIISYKAPYSIDFPFKYPVRFFCEQNNFHYNFSGISKGHTSVNKNYPVLKEKLNKSSNLTDLKKILNNYRLKINKLKDYKYLNQSEDLKNRTIKELNNNNLNLPVLPTFDLSCKPLTEQNSGQFSNQTHSTDLGTAPRSTPVVQLQPLKKSIMKKKKLLEIEKKIKIKSIFSSIFFCPIAEYSLGKNIEKSILYPNNIMSTYPIQNTSLFISNHNFIYNKKFLSKKYKEKTSLQIERNNLAIGTAFKSKPFVLGSLNNFLDFSPKYKINYEVFLYKTEFESFIDNKISPLLPFINTYNYCCFEGELIFKSLKHLIKKTVKTKETIKTDHFSSLSVSSDNKNKNYFNNKKKIKNSDQENLENSLFANKRLGDNCIILTKKDQLAFYLDPTFSFLNNNSSFNTSKNKSNLDLNYKQIYLSLENLKKKNRYLINDIIIKFLNLAAEASNDNLSSLNNVSLSTVHTGDNVSTVQPVAGLNKTGNADAPEAAKDYSFSLPVNKASFYKINKLPIGTSYQKNKLLVGEFLVYGDQISPFLSVTKAGQIIHINNSKVTLRHGQPIFVSPKAIIHKYDTDFIDEQSPVITLSYQQLKTGDIIQGIPKVEQFFEARTTKRGRLFRDSLKNLLKGLFRRYCSKGQPSDQAVRQSFYKIQQIIVDGVQRVYRSQGVSIADKHLEVIVKQMTSKVRIIEGGQTGFFPGEIVDLNFIEQVNSLLMRKITYEPLVLGITKASLEVDSFLSAASFQQTTRVLSNAAISRKKDFLKGLKENVILGNLIPAGTGYLVYLD